MKTSVNGLQFIRSNEGDVLHPYLDSAEIWTIGVGHRIYPDTVVAGTELTEENVSQLFKLESGKLVSNPDAKPQWKITESTVLTLLATDVVHVEAFLNFFLHRNNLTITQNQFDAMVSFGFNAGVGSLAKLLSHGLDNVPLEILKWDIAGGKQIEGLESRRIREAKLFKS